MNLYLGLALSEEWEGLFSVDATSGPGDIDTFVTHASLSAPSYCLSSASDSKKELSGFSGVKGSLGLEG